MIREHQTGANIEKIRKNIWLQIRGEREREITIEREKKTDKVKKGEKVIGIERGRESEKERKTEKLIKRAIKSMF